MLVYIVFLKYCILECKSRAKFNKKGGIGRVIEN
jgi:hypothetical protein